MITLGWFSCCVCVGVGREKVIGRKEGNEGGRGREVREREREEERKRKNMSDSYTQENVSVPVDHKIP